MLRMPPRLAHSILPAACIGYTRDLLTQRTRASELTAIRGKTRQDDVGDEAGRGRTGGTWHHT